MCDFGLSKTKDKHAEIFLAISLVAHTIKDGCCTVFATKDGPGQNSDNITSLG